jgi:hypothetical protein
MIFEIYAEKNSTDGKKFYYDNVNSILKDETGFVYEYPQIQKLNLKETVPFSKENPLKKSKNIDLIIDCTDNVKTRLLLNEYCKKNNIEIEKIGDTNNIIRLLSLRDSRWNEDNATPLNKSISQDTIDSMYADMTFSYTKSSEEETFDVIPEDKLDLIDKAANNSGCSIRTIF